MLVTSPPNVRYLSGFSGSSGALLVGEGRGVLFTDSRYTVQAAEEAAGVEVRTVEGPPAAAALETVGEGRIGFEADSVTVEDHRRLSSVAKGASLIPLSGHVEALREIKEPGEVAAIEASLRVTSEAFEEGVSLIREGVSEIEVASAVEGAMRRRGAAAPAFESIVGSGPRGALPHARATTRRLRRGEAVIMDIGAMVDGYASDMTRTVFLGEPGARGREIYAAVLEAVRRAEGEVREGASAGQVDAAARHALDEAGLSDHAYGHGTGHGLGLQVHERPRLARGREERLREGMVLTIEPGVYIPDWGGVRIEDVVLVEQGGCRIMTPTSKNLLVV